MQISIDSFGAVISDPASGLTLSAVQRMNKLPDEIVLADQVGLDVFFVPRDPSLLSVTRQKHDEFSRRPRSKIEGSLAQQTLGTANARAEIPSFHCRILHVITAIPLDNVLEIRGYRHMVIDRAELRVAGRGEMPC